MPTWTKEQQTAIEKSGTNIIVSAGAGSGKTAVLSERVIYKLKSDIHIDELLILTFTRAAAEEMKDRIRKKIKKEPTLKRELDALDSSYITTFDSFALSVVKKYHYLLNIKKEISITDDTIVKLEMKRILDEVFEESYEKNDERFTNLISRYCLKNDKPLKTAITALLNKLEGILDKDAYFDYIKNDFFSEQNIEKIIGEFKSYVDDKKKVLYLELNNSYSYFDEDYIEKLNALLLPILNIKTLDELVSYSMPRLPSLKRGTDDEVKKIKENVKHALDDLMELKSFGTEDMIKDSIMSTKETVLGIIELLENFYKKLKAYKKANDIYTFGDIAELSINILTKFPKAKNELKDKFKEIMIDEYQDTNDVQETFISLISSNNVYMVGDIKQSIYRFRGSNPNIFKDKYDNYTRNVGGYKIDLIKNFRSREEVLSNINSIFELIMDDDLGGAAYKVSHEMVFGNSAYLEKRSPKTDYNFEVLEYEKDENKEYSNHEIEIFTIARDIQKRMNEHLKVFDKDTGELRPFRYSDAVIILDRSKYFDDFKKIFEYMKIPLTILRDDKLNSSMDIYLVKNLIDLLLKIKDQNFDTEFKYAFMSIGRSFLYEYTDQDLFEFITNNSYKNSTLYKDLEKIESINSKTIKELLEEILDITGFYEKIYKIGDFENTDIRISKLVDLATNIGAMGLNIYDFKEYLSNIVIEDLEIKYAQGSIDVDSVKILTIHKSKGLEYPLCYFADMDHSFNTKELKEKFILDKEYGIITPISIEGDTDTDSVLKVLYKSSFMNNEISEKIRLFYVALTRAREKMIIVVPYKDTTKLEKNREGTIEEIRRLNFKCLADFIYGVKDYLPEYFRKIDKDELNLSKDYLYNKTPKESVSIEIENDFEVTEVNIENKEVEKKTFSKSTNGLLDKNTISTMRYGTKIHEILEFLEFDNYNIENYEDEFIKKKIDAFMNIPIIKNSKGAKIYHEYEFVYNDDENQMHGSIDLMIERDNDIDIIDYKLKNTKDEHYIAQLNGYKKYIEQQTSKKVHTYLYSIIDENIVEID